MSWKSQLNSLSRGWGGHWLLLIWFGSKGRDQIFFLERDGLDWSGDSFLWHEIFIKKSKILKCFLFFKIIFLKYNVSAPFSVVEAKTHIFNIHIGLASHLYYKIIFHFSFFLNNLHVLCKLKQVCKEKKLIYPDYTWSEKTWSF